MKGRNGVADNSLRGRDIRELSESNEILAIIKNEPASDNDKTQAALASSTHLRLHPNDWRIRLQPFSETGQNFHSSQHFSSIFYLCKTYSGCHRESFKLCTDLQVLRLILTVFNFFAITVSNCLRRSKFEGWDIKPTAKHWFTTQFMDGISCFWPHEPLRHSTFQKCRFH